MPGATRETGSYVFQRIRKREDPWKVRWSIARGVPGRPGSCPAELERLV